MGDEGPAADRPVAEAPREPRGSSPLSAAPPAPSTLRRPPRARGTPGRAVGAAMPTRGVGASRSRSTVASAGSEALPSGEGGEGPVVVEPSSAVTATGNASRRGRGQVIGTLGAKGGWRSRPEGAEQEKAPGWLISSVLTPLTGLPPGGGRRPRCRR